MTAALGVGLLEAAPGVRGVRFDAADQLRNEGNVLVVGPHCAAALALSINPAAEIS
jgi:hypothetical protein